jgi:hypothetical protein
MTLHGPYSSSESVLETAGRELLGSITGGGRWVDALDRALPKLNCLGGALSCIMPPRLFGVPSRDMTETFEAIAAGRTPPLTEATRMISAPQDGFLCDQMDLYRSPRERDAFYMEFIRRRGLAYQASAYLDGTGSDTVNLMVFRPPAAEVSTPAIFALSGCSCPTSGLPPWRPERICGSKPIVARLRS